MINSYDVDFFCLYMPLAIKGQNLLDRHNLLDPQRDLRPSESIISMYGLY